MDNKEDRTRKLTWLIFGILLIVMGLVLCFLTIYLLLQVVVNYESNHHFIAFLTLLGSFFSGVYGLFLAALGIKFCVISKDPDN